MANLQMLGIKTMNKMNESPINWITFFSTLLCEVFILLLKRNLLFISCVFIHRHITYREDPGKDHTDMVGI